MAKAWVVDLACRKAKDLGYPHELWTTRLLARHAREGLVEGDAHVIRNAGGRATDDAIRSLVISHKLLGTREWFVSRCRAGRVRG